MSAQSETEAKLRRQIAEHEAKADALKAKLAKILSKKAGEKPVLTGLDQLWKEALPTSRLRTSKLQCRTEWNKIPKAERPPIEDAVAALKAWNRSDEWKKEGNAFAPGLHRFIKNRMWEYVPEVREPVSRYRQAPKPIEQPAAEPLDPAEMEAAMNEMRKRLGMPTPQPQQP